MNHRASRTESYVEASPGARWFFFCAVLLLAALGAVLVSRPPAAIQQDAAARSAIATTQAAIDDARLTFICVSVGHVMLLGMAVGFAVPLLRHRRWPPPGMRVPFRTRVRQYSPVTSAALGAACIASTLANLALAWHNYQVTHASLSGTLELLERMDAMDH